MKATVVLPKKVYQKLETIKGRVAHKKKDLSQIIELMIDLYLEETDPTKEPQRKVKAKETKGRSFSAHVRREAFKKAGGKCEN